MNRDQITYLMDRKNQLEIILSNLQKEAFSIEKTKEIITDEINHIKYLTDKIENGEKCLLENINTSLNIALESINKEDIINILSTSIDDFSDCFIRFNQLNLENIFKLKTLALEYALCEYNQQAKEKPAGSNSGKFVIKYNGGDDLRQPWCGHFIYWCFLKASNDLKLDMPFNRATVQYVPDLWSWGRNNKTFKKATQYIPEPGDIFIHYITNKKSHTGMIWEYFPNSDTVKIIEGNYSDKVNSRTIGRQSSYFQGFINVDFC